MPACFLRVSDIGLNEGSMNSLLLENNELKEADKPHSRVWLTDTDDPSFYLIDEPRSDKFDIVAGSGICTDTHVDWRERWRWWGRKWCRIADCRRRGWSGRRRWDQVALGVVNAFNFIVHDGRAFTAKTRLGVSLAKFGKNRCLVHNRILRSLNERTQIPLFRGCDWHFAMA